MKARAKAASDPSSSVSVNSSPGSSTSSCSGMVIVDSSAWARVWKSPARSSGDSRGASAPCCGVIESTDGLSAEGVVALSKP